MAEFECRLKLFRQAKGLTQEQVICRLLSEKLFNVVSGNIAKFHGKVAKTFIDTLLSDIDVLHLLGCHKTSVYSKNAKAKSCMLFSLESLSKILSGTKLMIKEVASKKLRKHLQYPLCNVLKDFKSVIISYRFLQKVHRKN